MSELARRIRRERDRLRPSASGGRRSILPLAGFLLTWLVVNGVAVHAGRGGQLSATEPVVFLNVLLVILALTYRSQL
jgi:hypothetical protein